MVIWGLSRRLQALEEQVAALTSRPQSAPAAVDHRPPQPSAPAPGATPGAARSGADPGATGGATAVSPWTTGGRDRPVPSPGPPPRSISPEDRWAAALADLRRRLTAGNPVARAGVVVLFFGVAFLLKYAADRALLPIEVRLAAVAAAGVAGLILGWRLRVRRRGFGLLLQGAGVGVIYLTLFAASRLYDRLPPSLALACMAGVVGFSAVLAVRQDAAVLAQLGAGGGFLAPVLVSTGGGSHVMLFAYYTLLNLGVVGIAWFRSWRMLNLLGFAFTFGIGAAWGFRYYRPAFFATTEPYLVGHFLLYTAAAVLAALRQPPRLRGYVDGALVFGLPLAVFGLQQGLVADTEFGLAYSSLVLGAFYLALAAGLRRRPAAGLAVLAEAYLALGVVFTSLAVPLALEARWTSAVWALEGAALVWVGLRQARRAARLFGLLLQLGAGAAYLLDHTGGFRGLPLVNTACLGAAMIAAAGLFTAFLLERGRPQLHPRERSLHWGALAWGLGWWLANGVWEIAAQCRGAGVAAAALAFAALTALGLGELRQRLEWRALTRLPAALAPVALGVALLEAVQRPGGHPLGGWGLPAWSLLALVQVRLLKTFEDLWPRIWLHGLHALGVGLLLSLITWETAWWTHRTLGRTWSLAVAGALPALAAGLLLQAEGRLGWPVSRWRAAYAGTALGGVTLYLGIWNLAAAAAAGGPHPLPFVPLVNPLELAQALALVVLTAWLRRAFDDGGFLRGTLPPAAAWGFAGGAVFVGLNAAVARTVHHWGGVAYSAEALARSVLFQAAVSVLWALTALGLMVLGARRAVRLLWFGGAGLLVLEVAKLFLVDLSGRGTVSRIVSFLAVGGLMLLIGYVAPLPPATRAERSA